MKIVLLAVCVLVCIRLTAGGEAEFLKLVSDVEADTLEMAREVELLYKQRCSDVTLNDCYKNNYEECMSRFPNQECPAGEQLADTICGDGTECSRLWDYSISRVSLPQAVANGPNRNPTDPNVIETVCFSRALDAWFVEKSNQDAEYWNVAYGLEVPPMYFGAHNGVFRIYPAHRASECGVYDPTVRPWYISASSGPKNILMILDISGSMNDYDKIGLMKQAAKRIVSTLTVADRIAIVPFASQPTNVIARDTKYMYTATEENKQLILEQIDGLEAGGQTNFMEAFQQGFDIFNKTIAQEYHVNCNSAVLFLTDGRMSPGQYTEAQVIQHVTSNLQHVEDLIGHPTLLFTYSVSEDAQVDQFPRDLACAVDTGVWSKIESEDEIVDSLTSYYHLFALGLGLDKNEDFTAWVEPYVYSTGGVLGTTVSAPVYDRDKDPPLFLGVVGVDLRMSAVSIALGDESTSLQRIINQSTAKCPTLELTLCELESFRRRGSAGDLSLCTSNCTASDFVEIEPGKCGTEHDYPKDLWSNTEEQGLSYEARSCCAVGENEATTECPESSVLKPSTTATGDSSTGEGSNTTMIAIAVVIGFLAVAVFAVGCYLYRKNRAKRSTTPKPATARTSNLPAPIRPPAVNPNFRPSAPTEI